MKFLAIKNYRKHQHYHKRGAPWIKLYSSVLADAAFVQMPEAAQAQLMKLWILASQFGHPLPNNPKLLAGKIGTTGKFHLAAMVASGFLIECDEEPLATNDENSSKMLAESLNVPPAEIERELEIETALQQRQPNAAEVEAGLAVLLDSDADRNALTVVAARANSPYSCLVALRQMLVGEDPACVPTPSTAVFGEALRDLAANGERPSSKKFRNYLDKVHERIARRSPPSGATATASTDGRRESFKDADERREREEGQRRIIRDRWGNVEQRIHRDDDGGAWWVRMQREAKTAGVNAVLYAYDRMSDPAEEPEHV